MQKKLPRNHSHTPLSWKDLRQKKKTTPPARRWSPIHLIPIALLSTIGGMFVVHSCTRDDESESTASGSYGSGGRGWFHSSGGGGGSHSQHGTDRGGFGSRGFRFFS